MNSFDIMTFNIDDTDLLLESTVNDFRYNSLCLQLPKLNYKYFRSIFKSIFLIHVVDKTKIYIKT